MNNTCPICSSNELTQVLELRGLPVAINAQAPPEQSASVPKANIHLVVCNACTHLFNSVFDETLSNYDSSYENSLHFSEHFRIHAKSLAKRLVEDYDLAGETVAEAGSGPGHFLELLCQEGTLKAYGFDPSYDPDRLGAPSHPDVILSRELFPNDGSIAAKMTMSQHVLEHLTNPVDLLRILRNATKGIENAVVYSEVPNGDLMIEKCALWDIIYEHVSFFTKRSLTTALNLAGLAMEKSGADFDGQFLWVASTPTDKQKGLSTDHNTETAISNAVKFGENARKQIERAKDELYEYRKHGPVVLWGAGSKGMTYLNLVADSQQISAVVDVNPRKNGFGVPGTSFTISDPASLSEINPKTILIANPIYKSEIELILKSNNIDATVFALWQ